MRNRWERIFPSDITPEEPLASAGGSFFGGITKGPSCHLCQEGPSPQHLSARMGAVKIACVVA